MTLFQHITLTTGSGGATKSLSAGILVTTAVVSLTATMLWIKKPQRSCRSLKENENQDTKTHKLLAYEKGLHLQGQKPITLTWFRGDYRKAATILQERGAQILRCNPWLGGRVLKVNGELSLTYASDSNFVRDHYDLVEPTDSPITRDTPVESLGQELNSLLLTNGPTQPLFRLTIVPCRDNSVDSFAVVVGLSHLVGDGYTFYRIHNMLCGGDEEEIVSLDPVRIETTVEEQGATLGKAEAAYGSSFGLMLGMMRGLLLSMTVGPASEGKFTVVDTIKMSEEKSKQAATTSDVSFVSANDVITSWFLQNCKCKYGFMTLNLRNRVAGHTDRHAGNYVNGIFYERLDSRSPSLIRQSVATLKRAVTKDGPMPTFWQSVTGSVGLITNWATFAKPNIIQGCQEELHVPLYDIVGSFPNSMCTTVIFRCGPRGLALYTVGSRDKLKALSSASFLSPDPLL